MQPMPPAPPECFPPPLRILGRRLLPPMVSGSVLGLGLLLTGCAPIEKAALLLTQQKIERPVIPAHLQSCLHDPEIPAGAIDDDALGQYLKDLWGAGDDCRAKLGELRGLLER